jgi:hypothetical protein
LELERRLREEDERGAVAGAAAGSGEEGGGSFERFREAGLSGA